MIVFFFFLFFSFFFRLDNLWVEYRREQSVLCDVEQTLSVDAEQ